MVRPSLTLISLAALLLSSAAFAAKNKSQDFYLRIASGVSVPSSLKKSDRKFDINWGTDLVHNNTTIDLSNYYDNKAPKGSMIYGVALGYIFSEHFRADFNISSRNYSFHTAWDAKLPGGVSSKFNVSQKISAVIMMLNGYYDIGQYGIVTPYITAGIGMGLNKTDDYQLKLDLTKGQSQLVADVLAKGKSKVSFAWNVGASISIAYSTNASIDIGYRFINLGDITTKENRTIEGDTINNGNKITTLRPQIAHAPAIKASLKAHEISMGFTYKF